MFVGLGKSAGYNAASSAAYNKESVTAEIEKDGGEKPHTPDYDDVEFIGVVGKNLVETHCVG